MDLDTLNIAIVVAIAIVVGAALYARHRYFLAIQLRDAAQAAEAAAAKDVPLKRSSNDLAE